MSWVAVGLAGLPGAAFGALAIVVGIFLAFIAMISFALARFPVLDHLLAVLITALFGAWIAQGGDWIAWLIIASVYCAALAASKLGRVAGRRVLPPA